jgi:C-lobe and N-lobe beta barrels of Tf-binding protein B
MYKPVLAALVAAGMLSACGGGGGGGGGGTRPDPGPGAEPQLAPLGQIPATDHHIDFTQQTLLTPAGLGSFDTLNAMPAPEVSLSNAPSIRVAIPDLNIDDVFGSDTTAVVNGLRVDTASVSDGTTRRTVTYLAPDAASTNPFKLQFSSLGVWNTTDIASGQMTNAAAFSVGTRTLGTDIPTTGTANYQGAMLGVAVEGSSQFSVSASAAAQADFGARNVSVQTTNSVRTDMATGAAGAAPGYNMSGTLTYPAATNALSGTMTTADGKTGTASGNFYGPQAAELGMTFKLTSPTGTLVGGAALKR